MNATRAEVERNEIALTNDSLAERIRLYKNTAMHNTELHREFTKLADTVPYLKEHRDFVEQNSWGFGDRAFHYMWRLLLTEVSISLSPVKALEIGVYKGQVISLWALIGKHLGIDVRVSAISPFAGKPRPTSGIKTKLRILFDSNYREEMKVNNFYEASDYLSDVHQICTRFALDESRFQLIKGYSNDSAVVSRLREERFGIVYIDGDHTFEGVRFDIRTYARLVEVGGYLVMDDASYYLPGKGFFRGYKSVSRACETIPGLGFQNVLNIGHNRVYKRTASPR